MYKIIRHYYRTSNNRTVKTGLTLEEAQRHCHDPETSSKTAIKPASKRRTRQNGPWFDGYEECKR
jgi:hypothetical protein